VYDFSAGERHVPHIALITQNTSTPTLEEWAKLDLSAPNSHVLRLTRVQLDDNRYPIGVEEVVLALERFPGLAANGGDVPEITELAHRHGLALGRATERLSIVRATKDVSSHLQIEAGTEVLKLNRIVETAGGDPIEWRVTFRKIVAVNEPE
jgi:DNA-binding GntR family transcriptional regulator